MTDSKDPTLTSLDRRITQAVDNIVRPLHGVLESELRSLVTELAAAVADEQSTALKDARDAAVAEKEAAVREALDAAGTHHDQRLAELQQASAVEREAAVREALDAAGTHHDQRLAELQQASAVEREAALTDALASERQVVLACTERLLDAIRRIDGAGSLSEVLEALADHVQAESGRVAVFLVRDGALRGWRFGGFSQQIPDPRAVEVPLDQSGVIARAVTGHSCAATSDRDPAHEDAHATPPPGSLLHLPPGRAGLAAPVCVGGQVVAVLYADEGTVEEPMAPSAWPELVEIAARHASRCLELLMAARIVTARAAFDGSRANSRTTSAAPGGAEGSTAAHGDEDEEAARRYARLLISEIKLYHESDVNEGKRERDLLKRLKPEIDRARRLYQERVPSALRLRVDCFEQELVRTLADGDAALLGLAT
ncbi:MAG: hypothetical protein IMZ55_03630 [Acidobacteria bacterium]|nr:hypothetical protein [Acidobacteriota bacterium]